MQTNFTPADARHLLDSSRSHPGRALLTFAFTLLGLLTVLVVGFSGERLSWPTWVTAVVPWAIIFVLVSLSWRRTARRRRTMQRLEKIIEATEEGRWQDVGEMSRAMLVRPLAPSPVRNQVLLLLAGASERRGAVEAAEVLYNAVRDEPGVDVIQRSQATLGLASALLRVEQLTDAVRLLDSLRKIELPPGLQAGVEMVRLFQEVLMGHFEAAAASVDARRPLFRRQLSTRAGFGYGLFAVALDALGRHDAAAAHWRDATLLMKPQSLTERFEVLRGVAGRYPAAESPI